MNEQIFVWEHFKFNAEQRLKGFNFFVLLSIFADGGVLTAIERGLAPVLLLVLGLFIMLLALVFWVVDARSQQLLRLAIPALKKIESSFSPESRLFAIAESRQRRFIRYTAAIRALHVAQLGFGLAVSIYGAMGILG